MLVSSFLLGLLALMLVAAAIWDIRTRTIPNSLNAAMAILVIPYWIATDLGFWPGAALHIGVALIIFLLFALVFFLGGMGGGDVKMAAALSLWLAPGAALEMLVIMSLAGGVLTLLMLIPHRLARKDSRLEVPYGVAIAFAGLYLLGERFLNQFS